MYNDKHVLNCLLPAKTERTYQLRNRRHNRSLLAKVGAITESEAVQRRLLTFMYILSISFVLLTICTRCGLSTLNKDDDDDDDDDDVIDAVRCFP